MAELETELALMTDVGRSRRQNEDFAGFYEPSDPRELVRSGRLYIVADGVGGAFAGNVASEYAVKKVLHEYYQSSEPDLGKRLQTAIRSANVDLFKHGEQRLEYNRMGTTLVAVVIWENRLIAANVGDSRAYLIRGKEIYQITRDHSLVAQLVREGSITLQEAKNYRRRNVILRSLGMELLVSADLFKGEIKPGDRLLLCSDGLTRYVGDEEIAHTATHARVELAVKQLVHLANMRGGKDNISALLIGIIDGRSRAEQEHLGETVSPGPETRYCKVIKLHRRVPTPQPMLSWMPQAVAVSVMLAVISLVVVTFVANWGHSERNDPKLTPTQIMSPTATPSLMTNTPTLMITLSPTTSPTPPSRLSLYSPLAEPAR